MSLASILETKGEDTTVQARCNNDDEDGRIGVVVQGMDLTGVDLTGVDLTGVDLTGVDLTGVDLTGSVDWASAACTAPAS